MSNLKSLALGTIACAPMLSVPAVAQDSVYVPLLTYRTGAFAGSGIHIADGMRDYLTMLNERDGGIGGVKLVLEECESLFRSRGEYGGSSHLFDRPLALLLSELSSVGSEMDMPITTLASSRCQSSSPPMYRFGRSRSSRRPSTRKARRTCGSTIGPQGT